MHLSFLSEDFPNVSYIICGLHNMQMNTDFKAQGCIAEITNLDVCFQELYVMVSCFMRSFYTNCCYSCSEVSHVYVTLR